MADPIAYIEEEPLPGLPSFRQLRLKLGNVTLRTACGWAAASPLSALNAGLLPVGLAQDVRAGLQEIAGQVNAELDRLIETEAERRSAARIAELEAELSMHEAETDVADRNDHLRAAKGIGIGLLILLPFWSAIAWALS